VLLRSLATQDPVALGPTPGPLPPPTPRSFLQQARSYDEATSSLLGWYLRNAQVGGRGGAGRLGAAWQPEQGKASRAVRYQAGARGLWGWSVRREGA
jgi:hypothetical protein